MVGNEIIQAKICFRQLQTARRGGTMFTRISFSAKIVGIFS